jgi:DNA polymerase I
MVRQLAQFREVWCIDFEFEFGGTGDAGELPRPVCLVAREFRSGQIIRLWRDEFGLLPPYPTDPGSLFVAYYASAELGCHIALDWPMPQRILDLFTEYRVWTNGRPTGHGDSLLSAMSAHGLDGIGAVEKDEMRDLILSGGPWSSDEQIAILDYCETDVDALARLLPVMAPTIDLPRALLRGRYMAAAARIEHCGIPIDTNILASLRERWSDIQDELIAAVDADYQVFQGRTFKYNRFEAWLKRTGTPWLRLDSGRLDLSDDAFREAARSYPAVAPLRELRDTLGKLRLHKIVVGSDGRNRTLLSAFRASSGRNQPSTSKSIFGPSVWLRGLIKPEPGTAIAYCDWEQQEFGIASALSGDQRTREAYASEDPYLAFAKQTGAVPASATTWSHGPIRELFKQCVLGTQYGMEEKSLAYRINRPPVEARELLRMHRSTYRTFWDWSDNGIAHAMLTGSTRTVFGWRLWVTRNTKERTLRNFPMQAHGSEMLRLACCLATERGIRVAMPVHDALLIEANIHEIDEAVVTTKDAMREASRIVLNGFELGIDEKIVRYPDRYSDRRGRRMWDLVTGLVEKGVGHNSRGDPTPKW